jgi:hypothetical protein
VFKGHAPILASWRSIFQAADRPRIQYRLITETAYAELAVRLVLEEIGTRARPPESGATVLATNVYQWTEQGWRMLGHHASQSQLEGFGTTGLQQLH